MVRSSYRAEVIKRITHIQEQRQIAKLDRILLSEDDDSVEDIIDAQVDTLATHISLSRYLFPRGTYRKRCYFDFEDATSPESRHFSNQEFLQHFRVHRSSFHKLVKILQRDPIFSNNYTKRTRRSVRAHLLVFLFFIGNEGSAANKDKISSFFGIGAGSVVNYTRIVTIALNNIKQEVIPWPGEDERREIQERIGVEFGFRRCVGILDGTLIFLQDKPEEYGECYFCRKKQYAVNVQIVCDDKLWVI